MCAFRVRDKAVPQLSHRGRTSVSGGRVALAGQPPLQGNGTCVWSLCAERPLAADRRPLRSGQVGAPLSEMTVWLKSSGNRPQKNQKPYFNFAHLSLSCSHHLHWVLSIFNVDVRLVQTSAFVSDQNSLLSITVDENSISSYNREIFSLEAEFRLSKCEYVITSEQQDQPPVNPFIRGTLYCESLFRLWTLCQRWTLGRNDWDCGCAIICQLRVHWKHESLTDTESIFAHHQYCSPHLSHCDFFTAVKIKDTPSTRLHTLCRGMGISGGDTCRVIENYEMHSTVSLQFRIPRTSYISQKHDYRPAVSVSPTTK